MRLAIIVSMKDKKILIHTALNIEARPFIGSLKLQKIAKNIWANDTILLTISGIGVNNVEKSLPQVFQNYTCKKAINIGIAGCVDPTIPIGSLFCTNQHLEDIPYASLTSVTKPAICTLGITTTLVDMEAQTFEHIVQRYLEKDAIFIFKVVSDNLSNTIPSRQFVAELIQKNLTKVSKYVL
ncbi:MAG: nucleoside phosphorylase [Sulfurospirillum sp.]|nr:nucleoside phosphorylase [Sulfurospirillum sp.]